MPNNNLRDAAIQAEYESGRRETTETAAKSHIVIRLVRMSAGAIVTLGGLALLVLPGPGLPLVAVGLAILARDVAWADRLLGEVRNRIPTNEQGGISRAALITMIVGATASVIGATWWLFVR